MIKKETAEKHLQDMADLIDRVRAAMAEDRDYTITPEDFVLLNFDRSYYLELVMNNIEMHEALEFYSDAENYTMNFNLGAAYLDKGEKAWKARFAWDDA